jgi:hypothetical protein
MLFWRLGRARSMGQGRRPLSLSLSLLNAAIALSHPRPPGARRGRAAFPDWCARLSARKGRRSSGLKSSFASLPFLSPLLLTWASNAE